MAVLQQDLEGFKASVEKDLTAIRKDFRELVLFLQEGPEPGDDKTADVPAIDGNPPALGADSTELNELKGDFAGLLDQVASVSRKADALREEIETVKAMVGDEAKSLRDGIADAKRDIGNKITYAVARLRT